MMNWGKKVMLKPTKTKQRGDSAPVIAEHAAGHLRPPVVQAAQEGDHRAADHHVMEMRDDEVGVVHVHVDGQRAEEQPGQPADAEEEEEAERVEHRRGAARSSLCRAWPAS